jgi:hypothetical protein
LVNSHLPPLVWGRAVASFVYVNSIVGGADMLDGTVKPRE